MEHPNNSASVLPLTKILFFKESKFSTIFLSRCSFTGTNDSNNSRGREGTLFVHLRTFRHLFKTLHLKWLPHIFNRILSNYQTAIRWALTPLGISFWLILLRKNSERTKKAPKRKPTILTLLEVFSRAKMLPLLFSVCLILFCYLVFVCDMFLYAQNFFVKKTKQKETLVWNCPNDLIYYTTDV